jgi:hypothetical protein
LLITLAVNFGLSSSRFGDVGDAWEGQVGFCQQSAGLAFAHRDYIAGPALVAGDVYHAAVHGDVTAWFTNWHAPGTLGPKPRRKHTLGSEPDSAMQC